jgi:hypothetical protein
MRVFALGLLPFAVAATAAQAFPPKLPPVEECSAEPGFTAFRDRLRDVAAKKDRQALLAMLAPNVTVNFGGDQGHKAFAEAWGLDRLGESDIWPLLRKILPLGCAVSDEGFAIPSLTIQFEPVEDEDFFDTFVVVSPAATLRSSPEGGSKAVATLAWDIVKAVDQSRGAQTKVRLQDGREGWVFSEELYNPAYYRMFLQNRGGKWVITAFVAGD